MARVGRSLSGKDAGRGRKGSSLCKRPIGFIIRHRLPMEMKVIVVVLWLMAGPVGFHFHSGRRDFQEYECPDAIPASQEIVCSV